MNTLASLSKPPLAVIAGPTASSKSGLAIALARRVPSTIINMDASQVYADLRVLTARPSFAEESEAPHRLFGHIDGADSCTAVRWADDARAEIAAAHGAGRLPILVGGTGLYMRTLFDGIAPVPDIVPAVREAVRALSVGQAYACLTTEDPYAAKRLAPTDTTRVARALEVVRSSGRPLKSWQAERVGGIATQVQLVPLILLPQRSWLLARCDARVVAMFVGGAVEEVITLLARGLDAALPVMRAIGVREIAAMIEGTTTAADAITATQLATRQYAKRQYTWFRNQVPTHWPYTETPVNHENIDNLAIKLHKMTLT